MAIPPPELMNLFDAAQAEVQALPEAVRHLDHARAHVALAFRLCWEANLSYRDVIWTVMSPGIRRSYWAWLRKRV